VNRYLLIRIVGSRSGGSDLLRLDLILSAHLASYGSGRWARGTAAPATGARLPRRRLAGDGRSWPSGLHPGRDQVLEVEHDMGNSSRRSGRRTRARVGDPHGEGGSGRRTRRRARVPGSGAAYGLRQLAQKEQGMEEELTKVL
jgi:hypothetical protein